MPADLPASAAPNGEEEEDSVTALDGAKPPHSTAFQRSHRELKPRLLVLLPLPLLLLLLLLPPPLPLAMASGGKEQRRHPYNEYTWELNQLNPWLSACDLAGPAPADLQGSCGPPEVPKNCPGPCPQAGTGHHHFDEVLERQVPAGRHNRTTAPEQCLFYLEESHKRDVCREEFARGSGLGGLRSLRENRFWFVSGLRLRHCCEHAAVNALAPGREGPLEAVLGGGDPCVRALDKLLQVDALAARLHCEFEEVLARYDCGQSYSVIHNCTHCKEAYRKWVCSSLVPYFAHGGPMDLGPSEESWTGRRIRPCRSLCQSVEQRCPYLLPGDRAPAYPTQYAGEPTFLCRDPNIPETGEQAARALHPTSEDECCVNVCSEEEPIIGLCANCTGKVVYMGPKPYDPPTAPQCDITSFPGQQQPARSQSSFCGSGGIGSMMPANSFFDEPSPSSLPPDSSDEASSPIGTTSTSTGTTTSISTTGSTDVSAASSSSSAASLVTSSPVPLLCLFWFWGFLFSSQCSVRCLLGLFGLVERCLRALRTGHARVLLPILLALVPTSSQRPQARLRLRRPRRRLGARCTRHLSVAGSAPNSSSRSVALSAPPATMDSALVFVLLLIVVVATRTSRRGHHLHCCCYRWWLWPSRWKHSCSLFGLDSVLLGTAGGSRRGRCYRCRKRCWWGYHWRWLWPCRWKGPKRLRHRAALLLFGGQQQPLRPRKKRRRKVRFGASCCRELDLARSTSWCREPS